MRRRSSPAADMKAYLERHDLAPLGEDAKFVVACLKRIPTHAHDWAARRYAGEWQRAMAPVEINHLRQNTGRRAANSWLVKVLKAKGLPLPDSQEIKQIKI